MHFNMLLGPRKWLKQIIEIKHNGVKNFNWPEANRLQLFTSMVKDLNSGLP